MTNSNRRRWEREWSTRSSRRPMMVWWASASRGFFGSLINKVGGRWWVVQVVSITSKCYFKYCHHGAQATPPTFNALPSTPWTKCAYTALKWQSCNHGDVHDPLHLKQRTHSLFFLLLFSPYCKYRVQTTTKKSVREPVNLWIHFFFLPMHCYTQPSYPMCTEKHAG